MPFRVAVVCSDWAIDQVGEDEACGSLSFCGARDRYPDRRPMGYPFDARFADPIADVFMANDNMAFRDFTIRRMPDVTADAFSPDFGFASLSEDPTERRFVQAIAARQDAVALIRRIAEQGEGLTEPQSAADDSHFEWFLDLYERWEQAGIVVRAVPRFPNTAATASADPVLEEGRITYPPSRAWALLSDVRYELLLLKCGLLFHQSRSDQQGATRRRLLLSSVMFEMRSSLRPLALRLMTLPRRDREPDGSIALFAGPPFSIRDEALPRDEAGLVAALRAGIALAAARAADIRNISGPDAATDADKVTLDRIAADDTRVLAAFGHA